MIFKILLPYLHHYLCLDLDFGGFAASFGFFCRLWLDLAQIFLSKEPSKIREKGRGLEPEGEKWGRGPRGRRFPSRLVSPILGTL